MAVELVLCPEIHAPLEGLSTELNHGLPFENSTDAKTAQIMVDLMDASPRGTKRKNLCSAE